MVLIIPKLPMFAVVDASRHAGIRDPLDHPWRELPADFPSDAAEPFTCDCHKNYGRGEMGRCYLQVVVPIESYAFEMDEGEGAYRLGQCPRCDVIYWSRLD